MYSPPNPICAFWALFPAMSDRQTRADIHMLRLSLRSRCSHRCPAVLFWWSASSWSIYTPTTGLQMRLFFRVLNFVLYVRLFRVPLKSSLFCCLVQRTVQLFKHQREITGKQEERNCSYLLGRGPVLQHDCLVPKTALILFHQRKDHFFWVNLRKAVVNRHQGRISCSFAKFSTHRSGVILI